MTWLAALVGPLLRILTALGIYAKGRVDARQKAALDAAEDYAATRRRMDEVDLPRTDDDLRRWLRTRDPRD